MYCGKCGSTIAEHDKHCSNCGASIEVEKKSAFIGQEIKCPACGLKTFDGQLRCPNCKELFWNDQEALNDYLTCLTTKKIKSNIDSVKPKADHVYCASCGSKMSKKDKYCGVCGSSVDNPKNLFIGQPITCPKCHLKTFDGQLFCPKCGELFWNDQAALKSYLESLPPEFFKENVEPLSLYTPTINKKKGNSKSKSWVFVLMFVGVIVAAAFIVNEGYASSYVPIFPVYPDGAKTVGMKCNYAGKNLSVDLTLYSNIDRYYQNQITQKEGYLKTGSYSSFVYSDPRDHTISDLASKIKSMGTVNNLNGDQTFELAMCFIQNIPYDNDYGAQVLTSSKGNTPQGEQYPYETLFNDKGICTTKTYLGSALAKELGYGTSLISLPQAEHMALGVLAPEGYSSFSSKYAYVEMTSVYPPGLIPDNINPQTGLPVSSINNLSNISTNSNPDSIAVTSPTSIKEALRVTDINGGNAYTRIVQVRQLENRIIAQLSDLTSRKANLQKAYGNISYWNSIQASAYSYYLSLPDSIESCTYYYYIGNQCYSVPNYNKTLQYTTYSNDYANYQSALRTYNSLVDQYNLALKSINFNINLYKSFDYSLNN